MRKKLQMTTEFLSLILVNIDSLIYADEIVLISDRPDKMQEMLKIRIEKMEKLKLELNIEKTK